MEDSILPERSCGNCAAGKTSATLLSTTSTNTRRVTRPHAPIAKQHEIGSILRQETESRPQAAPNLRTRNWLWRSIVTVSSSRSAPPARPRFAAIFHAAVDDPPLRVASYRLANTGDWLP